MVQKEDKTFRFFPQNHSPVFPCEFTCVVTLLGLVFCGEGEGTGAYREVGGAALLKAPPESWLDGYHPATCAWNFW